MGIFFPKIIAGIIQIRLPGFAGTALLIIKVFTLSKSGLSLLDGFKMKTIQDQKTGKDQVNIHQSTKMPTQTI